MPHTRNAKTATGKKSASREQQLTREAKSSSSSAKSPAKQAKREQASKAADAGAAPEQLDTEPE
jgi:hypothetical protein